MNTSISDTTEEDPKHSPRFKARPTAPPRQSKDGFTCIQHMNTYRFILHRYLLCPRCCMQCQSRYKTSQFSFKCRVTFCRAHRLTNACWAADVFIVSKTNASILSLLTSNWQKRASDVRLTLFGMKLGSVLRLHSILCSMNLVLRAW